MRTNTGKRERITTTSTLPQVLDVLKGNYVKDGKQVQLPWIGIAIEKPSGDDWTEIVEGKLWIKL